VTKDGIELVRTHHLGIFDNSEFLIDNTRRSGGLRPENRGTLPLFAAGLGASPSSESDGFYSWHLLNPVALINREDT